MKFIAAIASLAFIAIAQSQDAPANWTSCASGQTQLEVTSFITEPYPFCVGEQVCGNIVGTLNTPIIEGAKVSITGRYLGKIVYTDNQDFCAALAAQGTPCPVPTSVTSLRACVTVKPETPAGVSISSSIDD
ncbi:hypothetical protein BGZ76_007808 [Entomortierella beljakovae]|nr:hypothetical protein BGZ76_007808 [Entomortierella beljakovae]